MLSKLEFEFLYDKYKSSIPYKNKNIFIRKDGEFLLISRKKSQKAGDNSDFLYLTGVGLFLWEMISKFITIEEIEKRTLAKFNDVNADEVRKDLLNFIRNLESLGAVTLRWPF